MVDRKAVQKSLDKIFHNPHFGSETDRKILKFLIDSTLSDKKPKEIDIAREIFHRDEDFNPNDSSIVRTHIYSLRKKLENYYSTDGVYDELQIKIPKGEYRVDFEHKSAQKLKKIFDRKVYVITIIILLLCSSLYYWQKSLSLESENNSIYFVKKDNPIWSDFLDSKLPTLVVIGNYYFYKNIDKKKGIETFIRNIIINSNKDLADYIEKDPQKNVNLSQSQITYLGQEVPFAVLNLAKVFIGHEDKLKIRFISDLSWQDIERNNIIFIGSVKTLDKMNYFLDKLSIKYRIMPNEIYYRTFNTDKVDTVNLGSYYYNKDFHYDFPIITKFTTNNGNSIMIITSFSSFGKTEALKELTSPTFLTKLKEKSFIKTDFPHYFEALLKVYGIEKNGFAVDVIHFSTIDSNILIKETKDNVAER